MAAELNLLGPSGPESLKATDGGGAGYSWLQYP